MKRWFVVLAVLLICLAGVALAGDTPSSPRAVAEVPSAQARLARVQQAMQENGIEFRADVVIGDDGRLMVRVVWVDVLEKK